MERKNINAGKIDHRAICSTSAIKQLENSMKSEHANIYQYKIPRGSKTEVSESSTHNIKNAGIK